MTQKRQQSEFPGLNSLALFFRGLGDSAYALEFGRRAVSGATQACGPAHGLFEHITQSRRDLRTTLYAVLREKIMPTVRPRQIAPVLGFAKLRD